MKKIISILLVIVMLVSTVTMTVSATETQSANQTSSNEATGSITNDDVTVKGTNSFGNMLSEELQQSTAETTDNGSRISNVEMNGTTASVTYDALMDCRILIGIFDENTDQLLASGKSEVSKEETSVEIAIETTEMPEYYVVKGYMLGGNNSPIAPEYNTTLYTQSIQEIKNKTVNDFDESQVLNLDESDETNFAVYKEGTVVVEYEEGYNVPELIDNENGKYIFSNATEELLSLQSGEAFSYQYSEKDVLVLVVDTISVDGTTVTITKKNAELKDIFELVKIEASSNSSECEIDNSNLGEGITYTGRGDKSGLLKSSGLKDTEFNQSWKLNYEVKDPDPKDDENGNYKGVYTTGSISLSLSVLLQVYLDTDNTYINFSINHQLDLRFSITGKLKRQIKELSYVMFTPVPGVNIGFIPKAVYEASATIEFTISIAGSMGYLYSGGNLRNTSINPRPLSKLRISGEIFVGFQCNPYINIICEYIAQSDLEGTAGLRITGEWSVNSDRGYRIHGCVACIGGDVRLECDLKAKVKLFENFSAEATLLAVKKHLCYWYFSIDNGEFKLDSKCPHWEYRISIFINDGDEPLKNTEISINGENIGTTDEIGFISTYLETGKYTLVAGDYKEDFEVSDSDGRLIINIQDSVTDDSGTDDNENNGDDDPTDDIVDPSKKCGEKCYWEFSNDGELTIYGSGDMYDYADIAEEPWFSIRDSIKSVKISNGVTSIGAYAFVYFENLSSVSISNSVTSIGEHAFEDCRRLTNIDIPDNVTSIGERAFSQCYNLSTVSIPDSMTTIAEYVFFACDSLKNIIIPDSVTSIGEYAFYSCGSLTNIDIPDSVTTIGEGAFCNCSALKSVYIPNNTKLGYFVFGGCENLSEFNVAADNSNYTSVGDILLSKDKSTLIAYPGAKGSSCTIPSYVNSIGYGAFYCCNSLTNIDIPDSVTSIGDYAFGFCEILEDITIPDSVTSIGYGAFFDCDDLTNIDIPDSVTSIGDYAFFDCFDLSTVLIPDSVTSIGEGTFYWCSNLSTVSIPDSVTSIGDHAFACCMYQLLTVSIPDSVTSIGKEAFYRCERLENITIPDSVTSIGDYAFYYCERLTNIDMSDSVTTIGEGTFYGCSSLTNIDIPDSVTSIGKEAFCACESLTNIDIPYGVTTIREFTFSHCYDLSTVSIPDSVTTIEFGAFYDCNSLKKITIPNSVTSIGTYAFKGCPCESSIVMPSSLVTQNLVTVNTNAATLASSEEVTVKNTANANSHTANINNLVANAEYFVVAVKSDTADDLLSADNLLYFTQTASDSEGNISLSYIPRENCDNPIVLWYKANVYDISKASIDIDVIYHNGKEHTPSYKVKFNGKTLEENVDYTVSGDMSVTDVGCYSLTFTGINGFDGTKKLYFIVIDGYQPGDVNLDGALSILDATEILKANVSLITFTDQQKKLADVNGDGTVTVSDATYIQKKLVGLPV